MKPFSLSFSFSFFLSLWNGFIYQLKHTRLSFVSFVLLVAPFIGLFFVDQYLLTHFRLPENSPANSLAQWLSRWGDFYTGCAIVILAVYLFGIFSKSKNWRTLALAMLLSGALAGTVATVLRFVTGRPRPSTQSVQVVDGFYGPRFKANAKGQTIPDYGYNSFPSAHATTAMAVAMPALIAQPIVGIPLTVIAVSIGWSRFQLNRHHPSDIYLGFILGGIVGLAFGRAMQKKS